MTCAPIAAAPVPRHANWSLTLLLAIRPSATNHLSDPAFYGLVETGDVNSYEHLWRYRDAARRVALYVDLEWRAYRDGRRIV